MLTCVLLRVVFGRVFDLHFQLLIQFLNINYRVDRPGIIDAEKIGQLTRI